ncbi:MAG: thioredoxin-dependent thiol peroxidase [Hydrogenobacter thermophilus]|uniref:thioredoxin-dependent thiol peroxidase n=1 Tax=Hydrogenobacter thermophilus TaxID=940 RepID=UPI001C751486|nr:thioredoxin-dependent thiol peroxidase [Hydrogenobacter thermophilus]MCS7284548.1 thioredoxin-dependent thiol peroxidase [Hydrogenobacter thermophilus]QWK19170.1 MAG: thioredoxin-dependent thiol peroxidase [Hydrogenobacter thermophilus]
MLKEGDKAPEFCLEGIDEDGKEGRFCLGDFLGKPLILYFYPKDDTPGCTQEACDFRDSMSRLSSMGIRVVGISPDSLSSHKKFREKHGLNFILLSDPEKEVARLYYAYGKKKMYGKETEGIIRSTFLIDEKGVIKKAWYNVKAKGHVENVLKSLEKE